MKLQLNLEIADDRIKSLLYSAFEGGSNYWYVIDRYDFGQTGLHHGHFKRGGKMQDPNNCWHRSQLIPLIEGCAVIICESETGERGEYRLDRAAIMKGFEIMATQHSGHFADFIRESDDAGTADVFLQCCLFGKVIFG